MWAITTGTSSLLKKKKNQVKRPKPESRVPETGSDPPIGSNRGSGRDSSGDDGAEVRRDYCSQQGRGKEKWNEDEWPTPPSLFYRAVR